jgi:putative transposase
VARPGWTCRRAGISEQTFYAWKRKYAGLGLSELRGLRQLREEKAKLKRLVADLSLNRQMLQEIVQKTVGPRDRPVLARWAQTTYQVSERAGSRGCCRWREPPYSIGVAVICRTRCACGCESWRRAEYASGIGNSWCC